MKGQAEHWLEKLLEHDRAIDRMANALMDRYSPEIDAIPIASWDSARELVKDLIRAGMDEDS